MRFRVSFRVSNLRCHLKVSVRFHFGFLRVSFRVSECHLGFDSKCFKGFMSGFFRVRSGSLRVCAGFSHQDFLSGSL